MSSHVKPNPTITEDKQKRALNLRAAIASAQEMLSLENHAGWQKIVSKMNLDLIEVEADLDEFHKLSHDERTVRLTERKDLRKFVGMMAKLNEQVDVMQSDLNTLEHELRLRKERSGGEN